MPQMETCAFTSCGGTADWIVHIKDGRKTIPSPRCHNHLPPWRVPGDIPALDATLEPLTQRAENYWKQLRAHFESQRPKKAPEKEATAPAPMPKAAKKTTGGGKAKAAAEPKGSPKPGARGKTPRLGNVGGAKTLHIVSHGSSGKWTALCGVVVEAFVTDRDKPVCAKCRKASAATKAPPKPPAKNGEFV